MNANVNLGTNEKDIVIKYGMVNLREEREAAIGSAKYVLSDISDIKKNYFRLGFHLWELRQNKYYEDFGYTTMEEFCLVNFDMEKSAVSRCINVFLHVCRRSEENIPFSRPTMFIQDKYRDYSYSQLCEMISMSEHQEKLVKPDMTITQIRELKNQISVSADQIKRLFDYIMKSEIYSRQSCLMQLEQLGKRHASHCGNSVHYAAKPGKIQIAGSQDYYSFKQILDKYEKNYKWSDEKPVATSQPEEKKNRLCVDDLVRLNGAARVTKIKSVDSLGKVMITVYDTSGKLKESITGDILLVGDSTGGCNNFIVRETE